jgi:hypothetical protein
MSGSPIANNDETRFNRSAWILLFLALIFIALDIVQLVYRFTLPTEGWWIYSDENDPGVYDFFVQENLVGTPSPLQPGDGLHIIGGISSKQIMNFENGNLTSPPPSGWEAGRQIPVTVIRDGQSLTFDIPIVHWTLRAWLRANFASFSGVMGWLISLVMFGVGLFTVLRRPGNLAARFLFLFGLAVLAIQISGSLPDGLGLLFSFPATLARVIYYNVIFAYLFGPSLLGFGLTFPRPKSFIQRRPWLLVLPFLVGSIPAGLLFIQPDLATIGFPLTLGMILGTIAALIHSALTMRDAISRAQLRWAVGGVVLGLGLFTLNFGTYPASGWIQEILVTIAQLSLPIIGISLGVAILRYRLFDIDVIIRRTLVYTILTVLLGLVYFGMITVLQNLFSSVSQEQSTISIVLSTLAIAALFNPLRIRLQAFIDRRFYRQKYNAEQALARFAATARNETDIEHLGTVLLGVVQETIQPESASLWLKGIRK